MCVQECVCKDASTVPGVSHLRCGARLVANKKLARDIGSDPQTRQGACASENMKETEGGTIEGPRGR